MPRALQDPFPARGATIGAFLAASEALLPHCHPGDTWSRDTAWRGGEGWRSEVTESRSDQRATRRAAIAAAAASLCFACQGGPSFFPRAWSKPSMSSRPRAVAAS